MPYDPNRHRRRSIRLRGYDYSRPGWYFVTICTQDRRRLFGGVEGGEVALSEAGQMAERWWYELERKFPGVKTDAFVVMPDHIHGIIAIAGADGAAIDVDAAGAGDAIDAIPSAIPSAIPPAIPPAAPSNAPSAAPPAAPSAAPSAIPPAAPSAAPSAIPSNAPSAAPSNAPSAIPSNVPWVGADLHIRPHRTSNDPHRDPDDPRRDPDDPHRRPDDPRRDPDDPHRRPDDPHRRPDDAGVGDVDSAPRDGSDDFIVGANAGIDAGIDARINAGGYVDPPLPVDVVDVNGDDDIVDADGGDVIATPAAISLSRVVQWYKIMTTNEYIRGVKQYGWAPFRKRIWQRNYYERIIRGSESLARIRRYIADNPRRWADDRDSLDALLARMEVKRMTPMNLTTQHLEFTAVAVTSLELDDQAGASIRGAVVGGLWERFGANKAARACAECPLLRVCPVAALIAPMREDGEKGGDQRPRPYVVQPPAGARRYAVGESLTFGLALFGQAAQLFPYVVMAAQGMEQSGLGRRLAANGGRRGALQIRRIAAVNPLTGARQPLYERGRPQVQTPGLPIAAADVIAYAAALPADRLTLHFRSPLRLIEDKRLVKRFAPRPFVQRLMRRLDDLSIAYGGGPLAIDFHALLESAEHVQVADDRTRWVDVVSYSTRSRQLTPIGGLIGSVTLEGDLSDLRELLVWGSLVHVGKNAVKGDGWYQIAAA